MILFLNSELGINESDDESEIETAPGSTEKIPILEDEEGVPQDETVSLTGKRSSPESAIPSDNHDISAKLSKKKKVSAFKC